MSLCYNPTANTITVNIIKARNLKAMDIGGTSGGSPHLPSPPVAFHYSACEMFEMSECIMGRRAGSASCGVEAAASLQVALLLHSKGFHFYNTARIFYE